MAGASSTSEYKYPTPVLRVYVRFGVSKTEFLGNELVYKDLTESDAKLECSSLFLEAIKGRDIFGKFLRNRELSDCKAYIESSEEEWTGRMSLYGWMQMKKFLKEELSILVIVPPESKGTSYSIRFNRLI